jgi:hypothetical protein
LSNYYTQDHDRDSLNNGTSFTHRREASATNTTGALPPLGSTGIERPYSSSLDFEGLIQTLQELFERDRQTASQPDTTRCGICYLHFLIVDLHYRDEGFYICSNCAHHLGPNRMPMLRKQQRFS